MTSFWRNLAITIVVAMTAGWAGGASHAFSALDPAALGARAVDKAKRSVGAVAIEPGRYTVVLEPTAVGNLLQLMTGAMNARGADEGRSFFSKPGGGNKIGDKVVDQRVTIVSNPFDPETYGTPFTGEGLPTRPMTWIENGVVKNLNYDRYWAQQKNVAPTVSGCDRSTPAAGLCCCTSWRMSSAAITGCAGSK